MSEKINRPDHPVTTTIPLPKPVIIDLADTDIHPAIDEPAETEINDAAAESQSDEASDSTIELQQASDTETETPPTIEVTGNSIENTPPHADAERSEASGIKPEASGIERASSEDETPELETKNTQTQYPAPRFIAWMNQKGGVGKTTSTVNVGAALAAEGKNVLLIDLDPQAHLTLHLGIDPDGLDHTLYDLFTDDDISAFEIVRQVKDNLCVLPAEVNLAGVENELAADMMTGLAQRILTQKCESLMQSAGFDYVLIDCPPSLGLLTINALTLAREVIVPMQAHFLALQGMTKLLETVQIVSQGFNPGLVVSGIVLCMHEGQTLLAGEIQTELDTFFEGSRDTGVPWQNAIVHQPPIRRNIKLAESPSFGQSIFDYDPECKGAKDYRKLAESLVAQEAVV